ncbi:T5orf172 domain protein [Bacteroidales bacterium Barb7]|nr:T5orf172 domain protein [Bacteroidales bacterium Barb7]
MAEQTNDYGIVYVLTNPAMPGLVKIGMTTRNSIEDRMKELFSTGVPVQFECEYACKVTDCAKVEKALHIAFQPSRINPHREFFSINPEQAIAILKLLNQGSESDITKEVVGTINKDLTEIDRVAGENLKKRRNPNFNFGAMNIPVGSKLLFIGDKSYEVEVCGDRKVLSNGEEVYLTAITHKLMGSDVAAKTISHWSYNGRNLQDIYNETYLTLTDE